MRWLLLLLFACDTAAAPSDPCDALRERRAALEAEEHRCERDTDCELVIRRPVMPGGEGQMGAPERPCSGTGVAAGRGEAWTRLDDELREAGCLAPSSGRCARDQWEAYCREGECSAHSTSGY